MKVPGILKNKYVCYALMALAALNVIGYLTVKAWECLALFSLTAYSVHSYCGDKSLAILAALFVANFVFGCGRVKEGFEGAFKGPVEKMTEAAGLLREAADECKVKSGGQNSHCDGKADATACTAASTGTEDDPITGAANACEWAAATVLNAAAAAAATDQASCEAAGGTTFTAASAAGVTPVVVKSCV